MKDASDKPQDKAAPVGARNDDSSLFSLESLKIQRDQKLDAPAAAPQRRPEESGLIDLKALAAIQRESKPKEGIAVASVLAPSDIFGSASPPLSAPSTIAVATLPADMVPAPKKNTGVIIASAVAAVAIAAAVFAFTRGPDKSAAVAPTAPTAPAPPTATAAPADTEPTVAAVTPGQRPAAPTATATATAAPGTGTVARVPGPLPKGPLPKPKVDEPPPPPPKPVDTCDLTCQMQRAVNKK